MPATIPIKDEPKMNMSDIAMPYNAQMKQLKHVKEAIEIFMNL
jgi:hypothetical protein